MTMSTCSWSSTRTSSDQKLRSKRRRIEPNKQRSDEFLLPRVVSRVVV
jgi:hypothetical protein